jgi:hypothetical protein
MIGLVVTPVSGAIVGTVVRSGVVGMLATGIVADVPVGSGVGVTGVVVKVVGTGDIVGCDVRLAVGPFVEVTVVITGVGLSRGGRLYCPNPVAYIQ